MIYFLRIPRVFFSRPCGGARARGFFFLGSFFKPLEIALHTKERFFAFSLCKEESYHTSFLIFNSNNDLLVECVNTLFKAL